MSDLDHMLRSLGEGGPDGASGPPAPFLAAVARRRRQRRLKLGASMAAALMLAGGALMLIRSGPTLAPATVPPVAFAEPEPDSLCALTRINPELTAESLRLPAGGEPIEGITIQVGMRWEPARIEHWVSR